MDEEHKAQQLLAEQHAAEDEEHGRLSALSDLVMPEVDILLRVVKGYGIIPIIIKDGKEVYRGDFQSTPFDCFRDG